MNDCFLCGWQAPTEANLRDHVLTCHPGQKNERPYIKEWETPAHDMVDWHSYRGATITND